MGTPIRTRWISFLWDWFSSSCFTLSAHRWRESRYVWYRTTDYLQFGHFFKRAVCSVEHLQAVLHSFETVLELGTQYLYQPYTYPLNHWKWIAVFLICAVRLRLSLFLQSSSVISSKRNYWIRIFKISDGKGCNFKPTSSFFVQELESCSVFLWLLFASPELFYPRHWIFIPFLILSLR